MATYTSYLNLKKPEGGERYALADFNANMDKIEAFATRSFTEKASGSSLIDIIKTFGQGTYNFRLDNASDGPISSGGAIYSVIKTHGVNDTRCAIIALPMDATNNTVYSAFLGASATSITWHQPWKKEYTAYKSAQDPDNYTTPGFYHIGASTHSPLGDGTAYGILVVYTGATGHCQQLFISAEAGRVFIRGRNASSDAFSAWMKMGLGTWTDVSSQFTVNATYCSGFKAFSDGHMVYVMMTALTGTPDQTNLVTNIASAYRPLDGYCNLSTFWMNWADSGKNACATVISSYIQIRTNGALEGTSGMKVSGCYPILPS